MPPRPRRTADQTLAEAPVEATHTAPQPAAAEESAPNPRPEPRPETDRWVQVAGPPAHTFCQICFPAGPQPGAGVIGCSHSTWVLHRGA